MSEKGKEKSGEESAGSRGMLVIDPSSRSQDPPPYRPVEPDVGSDHLANLPKVPTIPAVVADVKNQQSVSDIIRESSLTDSKTDEETDSDVEVMSSEEEALEREHHAAEKKHRERPPVPGSKHEALNPKQEAPLKKSLMGNRLISSVYVVETPPPPQFENESKGPPDTPAKDDISNNNRNLDSIDQQPLPTQAAKTPSSAAATEPQSAVTGVPKTPNVLVVEGGVTEDLDSMATGAASDAPPAVVDNVGHPGLVDQIPRKSFTRIALRPEVEDQIESRATKMQGMLTTPLDVRSSSFEMKSTHSQTSRRSGIGLNIVQKPSLTNKKKRDKVGRRSSNESSNTNSMVATALTIRSSSERVNQRENVERDRSRSYKKPKGFKNLFGGCLKMFSSRSSTYSTDSDR